MLITGRWEKDFEQDVFKLFYNSFSSEYRAIFYKMAILSKMLKPCTIYVKHFWHRICEIDFTNSQLLQHPCCCLFYIFMRKYIFSFSFRLTIALDFMQAVSRTLIVISIHCVKYLDECCKIVDCGNKQIGQHY